MRISKIECYPEWPMTFKCPNFPDVSIEISLPSDMQIKREYNHKIIEDTPIAIFSKETVGFECPICGNLHEIDKGKIPLLVFNKIPVIKV